LRHSPWTVKWMLSSVDGISHFHIVEFVLLHCIFGMCIGEFVYPKQYHSHHLFYPRLLFLNSVINGDEKQPPSCVFIATNRDGAVRVGVKPGISDGRLLPIEGSTLLFLRRQVFR
jgi:hypothetical protein